MEKAEVTLLIKNNINLEPLKVPEALLEKIKLNGL